MSSHEDHWGNLQSLTIQDHLETEKWVLVKANSSQISVNCISACSGTQAEIPVFSSDHLQSQVGGLV